MIHEVHINTVTGKLNAISISDSQLLSSKELVLTTVEANASNPTFVELKNTTGGTFTLLRTGVGNYSIVGTGMPTFDEAVITATNAETNELGIFPFTIIQNQLNIGFVQDGVALDSWVKGVVSISFPVGTPTTDEDLFSLVLAQLDSNQLDYWQKIVLRTGTQSLEINGNTWRRTSNFIASSKEINV